MFQKHHCWKPKVIQPSRKHRKFTRMDVAIKINWGLKKINYGNKVIVKWRFRASSDSFAGIHRHNFTADCTPGDWIPVCFSFDPPRRGEIQNYVTCYEARKQWGQWRRSGRQTNLCKPPNRISGEALRVYANAIHRTSAHRVDFAGMFLHRRRR